MGCARTSHVDEPGRRVARQRPSLVLPRGRFRRGTKESTRSRLQVRRGATHEPEHANAGVLGARSRRILRHDQRALWAPAKRTREAAAQQALEADEGAESRYEDTAMTTVPSRLKRRSSVRSTPLYERIYLADPCRLGNR